MNQKWNTKLLQGYLPIKRKKSVLSHMKIKSHEKYLDHKLLHCQLIVVLLL